MQAAIANRAEDRPSDDGSRPSAGAPHLHRTLEQCDLLLRQAEQAAADLRRRAEADAARIREETSAHVAWRLDLVTKLAGLQADQHRRRAEVEAGEILDSAWHRAEALQLELLEEVEAEATAILERAERDAALLRRGAEQLLAEARTQRADIDLHGEVIQSQAHPREAEPQPAGSGSSVTGHAATRLGEDAGTVADEPAAAREEAPATEGAGRRWASRLVARSFLSMVLVVLAALAAAGWSVTPFALTMWW